MAEVTPWREIVAVWHGDTTFIGRNPTGGTVQMGTLGVHPGVSPMELILAGLAGCTGADVASILQKKRQPLEAFQIRARGKRAEDTPRVYTEFEVEYLLWGDLDPQAVVDAIQLSTEKYCSVGAMLEKAAPIQVRFRILKPGDSPET